MYVINDTGSMVESAPIMWIDGTQLQWMANMQYSVVSGLLYAQSIQVASNHQALFSISTTLNATGTGFNVVQAINHSCPRWEYEGFAEGGGEMYPLDIVVMADNQILSRQPHRPPLHHNRISPILFRLHSLYLYVFRCHCVAASLDCQPHDYMSLRYRYMIEWDGLNDVNYVHDFFQVPDEIPDQYDQ